MKAYFLPIGLVSALVLAMCFPSLGSYLATVRIGDTAGVGGWGVVHGLVAISFLLTGMYMKTVGMQRIEQYLSALVIAIICNVCIFPVLVFGCMSLPGFPPLFVLGAAVMACVPTTMSSAIVISRQAGGDDVLAILLTLVLSLVGVCVLPFSLPFLLHIGTEVSIDAYALLLKLGVLVLLPCACGAAWSAHVHTPRSKILAQVPSLTVIVIVWMMASSQAEVFTQVSLLSIVGMVLMSLLLHGVVLWCAVMLGRWVRLDTACVQSLAFTSSQKTLPIAIAVLASIEESVPATAIGMAIVLCIVWHMTQILADALIAGRWAQCHAPASES